MDIITTFSGLAWLKHMAFPGMMILPLHPNWKFFLWLTISFGFDLSPILRWAPWTISRNKRGTRLQQSPVLGLNGDHQGTIITAKCDSGFHNAPPRPEDSGLCHGVRTDWKQCWLLDPWPKGEHICALLFLTSKIPQKYCKYLFWWFISFMSPGLRYLYIHCLRPQAYICSCDAQFDK